MKEFIELSSDRSLKLQFTNQPPSKFWINAQNAYPTLAKEALKKFCLLQLPTYVKQGFHTMCQQETKYRGRYVDAKVDMCIQLSNITADNKSIFVSLQAHLSH